VINMSDDEPATITQSRAARIIGCARGTIPKMIDAGQLEAVMVLRTRRVLVASLVELLRDKSTEIVAPANETKKWIVGASREPKRQSTE
jgi:excisionase family DNA binding protein